MARTKGALSRKTLAKQLGISLEEYLELEKNGKLEEYRTEHGIVDTVSSSIPNQELQEHKEEVREELKVMLKDKSSGRSVLNNKKSTQKIDSRETHQNIPKCPTCQSTNIKKISATSKATNAVLFGLFGNKRKKQFHCNNCGYEW